MMIDVTRRKNATLLHYSHTLLSLGLHETYVLVKLMSDLTHRSRMDLFHREQNTIEISLFGKSYVLDK